MQVALSRQSSPQAEQHRALHSLAELFPPQHVEGLHPGLLLYFPLGDVSHSLPNLFGTVKGVQINIRAFLHVLSTLWLTLCTGSHDQ